MNSLADAPIKAEWTTLPGTVRHTFTHFHLELVVYCSRATGSPHLTASGIRREDRRGGITVGNGENRETRAPACMNEKPGKAINAGSDASRS